MNQSQLGAGLGPLRPSPRRLNPITFETSREAVWPVSVPSVRVTLYRDSEPSVNLMSNPARRSNNHFRFPVVGQVGCRGATAGQGTGPRRPFLERLVEPYGRTFWLERPPRSGTKVTLTFPPGQAPLEA